MGYFMVDRDLHIVVLSAATYVALAGSYDGIARGGAAGRFHDSAGFG
jgi:hypothetical protein